MKGNPINILVLCTGNSCRSQMAEAYLKKFAGSKATVYSAGIEAHGLNPRAIAVMQEDGIDISAQTSDLVTAYAHMRFDLILTVCDNARERCPVFPSTATMYHYSFPDPARATGPEEAIMDRFRQVRDEIRDYCSSFVAEHVSVE